MSSNYIYDPYVVEFTNQSEVTANHLFGRQVNVKVIIDGEDIECEIVHEYNTGTNECISSTAKFYECGVAKQLTGLMIVS